jgi:hypothetical protein
MKFSNGPITLINLLKNVFFKCRRSEKSATFLIAQTKKTKKLIFGIKECYFSDCTNKQTKKEPPKNNNKKNPTPSKGC